jgi:hypothetical protein
MRNLAKKKKERKKARGNTAVSITLPIRNT